MMSLVAYDQSDDSDEEDTLPSQSKITTDIPISASKKRKEGVKITIPSLKEYEDEECPVVTKKPKVQSTSGLFGLLPPPKNASTVTKTGFVPYVLSSKKANAAPAPPKPKKTVTKNEASKITASEASKVTASDVHEEHNSDEEVSPINDSSENSRSRDFFSLDYIKTENTLDGKDCFSQDSHAGRSLLPVLSEHSIKKSSLPEPLSPSTYSDVQQSFVSDSGETSYAQQDYLPASYDYNNVQEHSTDLLPDFYGAHNSTEPVFESNLKESLLKDKEFLKLQGRRREFDAADIIDVNADDQLTDKNEWLMKSLTEESTHRPSRKKCNMPTQQQKRKHQITYLAFQAKEREMDLKNQWAMNSRTRRETQAKYGF